MDKYVSNLTRNCHHVDIKTLKYKVCKKKKLFVTELEKMPQESNFQKNSDGLLGTQPITAQ